MGGKRPGESLQGHVESLKRLFHGGEDLPTRCQGQFPLGMILVEDGWSC